MRQFVIDDQPKDWLFDIDGNVFHPKLRNTIDKGMIVGLRITERDFPNNERIKIIDDFKDYQKQYNEYMKLREKERQKEEQIKEKIRELLSKYKSEFDELIKEKYSLENLIINRKEKLRANSTNKLQVKEEIDTINRKLSSINEKIRKNRHHNELLNTAVLGPKNCKNFLIDIFNFSKELFDYDFNYSKFDELENLFFETATKDKPWRETIFFKIIKRDDDKLYGEVVGNFRRIDSKCPLKTGDKISFYAKSIFLVPSILNKKSKLNGFYLTNYSFKYYRSRKLTDWSGVFLDEKAREYIIPGTIVRIQLKEVTLNNSYIYYVYVLEKEGKYFWGEILDFYIVIEEKATDPVKIGCIYKFSKENVTEIPLMWNKHLAKLEKYKNRENYGYLVTGYRSDDDYSDLNEFK